MQYRIVFSLALVAVALYALPVRAQECATQAECGRLIETLTDGAVLIEGKSAIQSMKVNGCDFVRQYTQIADGCEGENYQFEQTDAGSFTMLSSASVMQHKDNAVSLLFRPDAVQRHRYCEECRVQERTIRDAGMTLPAVNPQNAQRLAATVSRLGRLCGAQDVNQSDPVTTEETRVRGTE